MATETLSRELANEVQRARMWRDMGGDEETGVAKCHQRINDLLDRWEVLRREAG